MTFTVNHCEPLKTKRNRIRSEFPGHDLYLQLNNKYYPPSFFFFLCLKIPSVSLNLSRHRKEGISLQCCISEKGSKHFYTSIVGLGLDSMSKTKSCLVLTLKFAFTSEKNLKRSLRWERERKRKHEPQSWCFCFGLGTCPFHIFVGSLLDFPVSFGAVDTPLTCSRHPCTLTTTVRSTLSLHHQCQLCRACVAAAGAMLMLPQGPGTRCSLHTLALHLSLIPFIAHPSLPGIFVQDKTLCQGVGGQAMSPRIFASPAQLQAGSQSGYTSSCHCQPTGFAVSPCQITDTVIGAASVEQGWDYTLRISISHSRLLTLVSNHPAGNIVYLAGQCKHTSRATGADLSA